MTHNQGAQAAMTVAANLIQVLDPKSTFKLQLVKEAMKSLQAQSSDRKKACRFRLERLQYVWINKLVVTFLTLKQATQWLQDVTHTTRHELIRQIDKGALQQREFAALIKILEISLENASFKRKFGEPHQGSIKQDHHNTASRLVRNDDSSRDVKSEKKQKDTNSHLTGKEKEKQKPAINSQAKVQPTGNDRGDRPLKKDTKHHPTDSDEGLSGPKPKGTKLQSLPKAESTSLKTKKKAQKDNLPKRQTMKWQPVKRNLTLRKAGQIQVPNPTDAFQISKQVQDTQVQTGFNLQAESFCPNRQVDKTPIIPQPVSNHSEEENKGDINDLAPRKLNGNQDLPKNIDSVERIQPLSSVDLLMLKEEMQWLLIQRTKDPISPQLSEVFFLSIRKKVEGSNPETEQRLKELYRLMSQGNKSLFKQIATDPEITQPLMKRYSEILLHLRQNQSESKKDEVSTNYDLNHRELEDEKSTGLAQRGVRYDQNRDQENPRDHTPANTNSFAGHQSLAYTRKSLRGIREL